jgi:hypothetical protein
VTNPESRIFDGPKYHLVRSEPYTRTDGSETTLSVWQPDCPVCGSLFEVRTPASGRKFQPNRRCSKHKRPGIRVNPRGGRKRMPSPKEELWPDIHDHTQQLMDAGVIPSDAEDWA